MARSCRSHAHLQNRSRWACPMPAVLGGGGRRKPVRRQRWWAAGGPVVRSRLGGYPVERPQEWLEVAQGHGDRSAGCIAVHGQPDLLDGWQKEVDRHRAGRVVPGPHVRRPSDSVSSHIGRPGDWLRSTAVRWPRPLAHEIDKGRGGRDGRNLFRRWLGPAEKARQQVLGQVRLTQRPQRRKLAHQRR